MREPCENVLFAIERLLLASRIRLPSFASSRWSDLNASSGLRWNELLGKLNDRCPSSELLSRSNGLRSNELLGRSNGLQSSELLGKWNGLRPNAHRAESEIHPVVVGTIDRFATGRTLEY